MKILSSRFLRGPNLYRMTPCFMAMVDLADHQLVRDDELQGAISLLHTLLPEYSLPVVIDANEVARLLARLILAMQTWSGSLVSYCDVVAVGPVAAKRYRLLCDYQHEAVVADALQLAGAFLTALLTRQPFDLNEQLAKLRELAGACALAPVATFTVNNEGRMPILAITGTNGKTTTTLLISHVLRTFGLRTGTTTTQGIYIDGECVESGDCSGYWSARKVLTEPKVEVAVLETARGGILKRGLAFDYCDVGVVLNVSNDHLGLDGVETLQDLAQVKGLVARCARDVAVLNADDVWCVAMRDSLVANCKPVFFSMDPCNQLLLTHLQGGGSGAFLDEEGWLVWCHEGIYSKVVSAVDLPVTLQGHARYNTANALAALAALCCLGLATASIAKSLASFASDAQSNPLRGNLFEVDGVKLIVDYAHNVVAYRALCQMARSLHKGTARLLGVVTSPGDRRSEDLYATGQVCGKGFDELVVYEHDLRGRTMGAGASEILRGARSAAPNKPIHDEPHIRQALWRGLAAAKPGDVLVFTCAGTFEDLVEGIRLKNPAEAARIAREISVPALLR